MKNIIFIILLLLGHSIVNAQETNFEDSLRAIISRQKGDTNEVNSLAYLASDQMLPNLSVKYAQEGLTLARKLNYTRGEADCHLVIVATATNLIQGIQSGLEALKLYENLKDKTGIASAHGMLQARYRDIKDYKKSIAYAIEGIQIAETNNIIGKLIFPGHRLAPLFLAEIAGTY